MRESQVTDMPISETSIVSRAQDVIATELDGEAVVMSIARGLCYGFDAVGTRIWTLIEHPIPVSEVCGVLVGEYEVDLESCRRDVTRLLSELARERLITVGNE